MELNITDIKAQSLTALKAIATRFNIVPTGDRRLKSTWISAIVTAAQEIAVETVEGAVQTAQEIVTYDNAVVAAHAINAVTRKVAKFSLKAVWSILLVSLALAVLAVEAYQDRRRVLVKIRMGVSYRVTRLKNGLHDRYQYLEMLGRLIFRVKLVQPVIDRRDRIRLVLQTAIN